MVKIMKPSKRIYEIARELKEEIMKQDISLENKITALEESLTGAVMFYLDEEWEKEQRKSTTECSIMCYKCGIMFDVSDLKKKNLEIPLYCMNCFKESLE